MAGYSGTPLWKKLGIKEGFRVRTTNAPDHYLALIKGLPEHTTVSSRILKDIDIWHIFSASYGELHQALPGIQQRIRRDGAIWVSWPKKASGVPSTITEDSVREIALPLGLVDIKVCAVDATWSALKLVIRKELR
tara:strand:+ start:911 stop:1315 length:405 start_codon:yes stop_codon:yes gene_type:complete